MFKMTWLDKFKLKKALLAEQYGENTNVLKRAVKPKDVVAKHSFPESLNELHRVAVIDHRHRVIGRSGE